MLATVKIIPFALSAALPQRVADLASGLEVLGLHPFKPRRIGLVQTLLPSVKETVLDKTTRLTGERLARSGSVITHEIRATHDDAELARAIQQLAPDNDMVIVFGASAIADSQDVIPAALIQAGGKVHREGMPVDPGNLLVLGEVGNTTVIGAPGCARSAKCQSAS